MQARFLADVHLGRLAKMLRIVGFDTAFKNDYPHEDLLAIPIAENRILLTKNIAFSQNIQLHSHVITSDNYIEQSKSVIEHFGLQKHFKPFTRCSVCNGLLLPKNKEEIIESLQKRTDEFYNEFWQCADCKRIYRKGSHYQRMQKLIDSIRS